MDLKKILNTRIASSEPPLLTPEDIEAKLPMTDQQEHTVIQARQQLEDILKHQDQRKFIVVGPCSIHDPKAAVEYAHKLKKLADQVQDQFLIIMRVYFEKPRTTIGWKGLINDPDINDSFDVEKGLIIARKLLLDIAEIGLPAGTEALDPITPQYLSELVTWAAIGARTIESQTHREMASGLSMPVGFKNGTDGNIQVALNAMESARNPHSFLGINLQGQVCVLNTKGNEDIHLILRGGGGKTNYDVDTIKVVEKQLEEHHLPQNIVIDCSHGNSNKDHRRQTEVFLNVIEQIANGDTSIVGMMLESNLYEGNQPITDNIADLKYGVSITDKCIGWEETERIILEGYHQLTK